MMMVVFLALLGASCLLFLGVGLWMTCRTFFTVDIPVGISHPKKLWLLYFLFQMLVALGMILEKLRICSMPQFIHFMHDLSPYSKDPDVVVTDLRYGSVPVKLYQPRRAASSLRPGIVLIHGGGVVLGSFKMYHKICCCLSKESDSVVLMIGYRLAPKHRFPSAMNDCLVATAHFLKSLDMYGVDPARVVLCGDSGGGGAAVTICQKFMARPDLPKIRAQILVYATLQVVDYQLPSFQQNKNVPMLSLDFAIHCMHYYLDISLQWKSAILKGAHMPAQVWEKYGRWLSLENIPERFKQRSYPPVTRAPLNEDAYMETDILLDLLNSPLLAEDQVVSQLPEACIVSCEYDLLRDNSLLYKKRLEDLGVPVTWHHMEDGFHGALNTFGMGFFQFPCATRILRVMVQFVKGL
ncbi:arylacetamide deacetylase-like 3 [Pipistrellus kuhlii]|uniref:Arylacetamide deacetylase like 3 n=1 Tax=Pipistrellus kuhlii TaxID=59472 RepID=A0A7J7QSW7_PIPKU|nr:arylacetamide deacetylase-like 3 [Pipistrellus kuhlii]KAF6266867.1 arylacetamide deacetylase like 3 [Pipistrellus kuhlii]